MRHIGTDLIMIMWRVGAEVGVEKRGIAPSLNPLYQEFVRIDRFFSMPYFLEWIRKTDVFNENMDNNLGVRIG